MSSRLTRPGRVAESWKISRDFTEFTVTIRECINFHNGTELDSEDVVGMSSLIFWVMFSEVKTKAAAFGLVLPISLAGALAIFVTAQWWVG